MASPIRGLWLVAIALSFAATEAQAEDQARVPTPPSLVLPKPALSDTTSPLAGVYVSDADPEGTVVVSSIGGREMRVDAGARLSSLGWFMDGEFVGIARFPPQPADGSRRCRFGWLRFRQVAMGAIDAEIFDDPASASGRRERWKARPPGADVDTREFNDYVYVKELPEVIEKVPPEYPERARVDGIEGVVLLQALVGKDGLVKDARVVKSIPLLDAAAVACVRKWRFKPALSKAGEPVEVWIAVPVRFTPQ